MDWPTVIILGLFVIRRDSEATWKTAALQTVSVGGRLIKPVPLMFPHLAYFLKLGDRVRTSNQDKLK